MVVVALLGGGGRRMIDASALKVNNLHCKLIIFGRKVTSGGSFSPKLKLLKFDVDILYLRPSNSLPKLMSRLFGRDSPNTIRLSTAASTVSKF